MTFVIVFEHLRRLELHFNFTNLTEDILMVKQFMVAAVALVILNLKLVHI